MNRISADFQPVNPSNHEPQIPCLSMRPREAAAALGVSARLLWDRTNKGEIPHVRLGKAILYPVESLKCWLSEQAKLLSAVDGGVKSAPE